MPVVDDSSDSSEPIVRSKKPTKKPVPKKEEGKTTKASKSPAPAKKSTKSKPASTEVKAKKVSVAPAAKRARKALVRTEEDFEPTNRWWEKDLSSANDQKWEYLEHRGMMFAPSYEPHNVPIRYDGEEIHLNEDAEEMATFFAQTLHMDWCKKPKFIENFWKEFKLKLKGEAANKIKQFSFCDLTPIQKHLEEISQKKKSRSKEEKEAENSIKKAMDSPFSHAIVDSLREKIGNFRVEPPNLFRGRGEHPKMGMLKKRILPEDVTLNFGPDAPAPRCDIPGHAYREVVHDNTVTWLAWYQDSINGAVKYVFLNAASGFKGQSDLAKYEKARTLKQHIGKIRADYEKKLLDKSGDIRQLGTAVYLIDRLALRVGNEKNTDEEADTVGCCSLRVEHIRFHEKDERSITLDFLGKDSIRYLNTVKVTQPVYDNLVAFCKNKKPDSMIFDIDPNNVNQYIKEFMPNLSAKVFRTYNASITLQAELARMIKERENAGESLKGDLVELLKLYNDANRQVAILCNHQRAPPKQFEAGMQKLLDKKNELEAALADLTAATTTKGKKGAAKTEDSSSAKKVTQLRIQLDKLDTQITEKEENKSVSLTTSKINYMDPRISVAFCKKFELPIEKVFPKTIRQKFPWAMHTKSTWLF
jgi:DNA topoisomerase I